MTDAIPPAPAEPALDADTGPAAAPDAPGPSLLPDEAALAARAQRGDDAAFAALYERFARMVHAILVSMVPFDEAPDLSQDVFVKAWRGLPGLREPQRFGPWLATIARNRGRDALKRPTLVQTGLPDDAPAPRSPEPGDAGAILARLRALPEAYRETLALRLVEGLTGPEIARRTGLTHGSVRVNLTRGMKLLRERLQEDGWA